MECEFCKTMLKSLSSLNYHKKTNKKCLEIQNNNEEGFIKCNGGQYILLDKID